jgi:DNA-binding transcriptional LysR family regulator
LAAAARALKISPATVGRRIDDLERRLGSRLFDRDPSGYALTENGEAFRLRAEDIEEAILTAEREALGHDLRVTGKVRIATADDIATYIIAPRLAEFRRSYQGIVLEIAAGWDVVNLTRWEADLALRTARPTQGDTARPTQGDYVVRRAGVWNCALYAAKIYAAAQQLNPDVSDLSRAHMIASTEESSWGRRVV